MRISPPSPPLSDGVVALRPWGVDGDVSAVARACRDPEIARWLDHVPQPYSDADARAYVEHTRASWKDGTSSCFAITEVGSGEAIGSISVRWHAPEDGVGEVGYWVSREARGRGAATRALRLVSRWALGDVGAQRLELRADELNEPSNRVAERAGFRREGVLRSSHYNARQQRRVDFVLYSLLRSDLDAAALVR